MRSRLNSWVLRRISSGFNSNSELTFSFDVLEVIDGVKRVLELWVNSAGLLDISELQLRHRIAYIQKKFPDVCMSHMNTVQA
jgi:hypothetical protein